MNFDTWLMQGPEKKSTKVELNSRREMLTEMMHDMDRMLADCDNVHPQEFYLRQECLYNNNGYEEEWDLYTQRFNDEN